MNRMHEASLVQACRAHDRTAQRELYERNVDRVYRVALRLTRNEQDAFDVAQETFVQAFENISSFDNRSSLSTWLYRIVTNEALQLLRRKRIEHKHLALIGRRPSEAGNDGSKRLELEDALERLSDEHRAILLLRYHESLSYGRIAEVLQLSDGTVASRLNRARADLRRILSGNSEPAPEEKRAAPHPTDVSDATERCPDDL